MKVNASKIDLTNDILERGLRWYDKGLSLKNAEKSNQYLVIYWDDLSIESFEKILPTLDKYYISAYLDSENIDNKEIYYLMLKHVETPNEEILWNYVVDSERLISNEIYLENSYQENFELWYKVFKKRIIKMSAPENEISVEEIVSIMDGKHISPAKQKEQNRVERMNNWLDSIIDINYVKKYKQNTNILHLEFLFKNSVQMLHFGFYVPMLKNIPVQDRNNYYDSLADTKAMVLNITENKVSNAIFYPEFIKLLHDNQGLPQTDIEYYVTKWFKNKIEKI